MANSPQLLQLSFAAGIDQGQHGEVLDPSTGFVSLENVRQNRRGGISKRLGFDPLPSARLGALPARSSGERVFESNGVAHVFDGESIDAWCEEKNAFSQVCPAFAASVTTREIATTGDVIDDVVTVNGYVISSSYVVSETLFGIIPSSEQVRVYRLEHQVTIETEEGSVIRARNPVYSIFREQEDPVFPTDRPNSLQHWQHLKRSRLAAHGTWVFLFVTDAQTKQIHAFKLNTENPKADWTPLSNPVANGYVFGEIGVLGSSDRVYLAYSKFSDSPDPGNLYVSPRTQLSSFSGTAGILDSREIDIQTTIATPAGPITFRVLSSGYDLHNAGSQRLAIATKVSGLAIENVAGLAYSGYPGIGATLCVADKQNNLSILSPHKFYTNLFDSNTQNVAVLPSDLVDTVYISDDASTDPYSYVLTVSGFNACTFIKTSIDLSHTISFTDTAFCVGSCVAAKPIVFDNKLMALANSGGWFRAMSGVLTGGFTLRDLLLYYGTALGTVVMVDASNVWERKALSPVALASSELVTLAAYNLWASGNSVNAAYGVRKSAESFAVEILSLDVSPSRSFMPCEHNGVVYFTNGVLCQFDGSKYSEGPFVHRPVSPTVAVDSDATAAGMSGVFSYVVTFETVDSKGNVQISAASDPAVVNNTSGKPIKVVVFPLSITSRLERDGREPSVLINIWRTPANADGPYQLAHTFENTTIDDTGFYLDDVPSLASNRLLYGTGVLPGTNGGAQDRRCPPYPSALASYNGMLVVGSGRELWYSGQTVSGEGVWFNPAFVVTIPDNQKITAMAVLEGTLYAFSARSIYAVAGDAPSDNGFSGGLGTPRRLAADVGCIEPRSIAVCALGVFFQSARGLELLTRGGAVSFIGQNVQDTLAKFPVITSATLDDASGLVRFTAQDAIGDTGVHLVFDLASNLWQSIDRIKTDQEDAPAAHACMVSKSGRRRFVWLSPDGTLHAERSLRDERAHFDGVSWVPMAAELSWAKFGGIQGRHFINRALLLAKRETSANVATSVFFDYSDEPSSVLVRSASTVDQVNSAIDRVQLDNVFGNESAGVSVKLRFEDRLASGGLIGNGRGGTWLSVSFEGVPAEGATLLPEGAS